MSGPDPWHATGSGHSVHDTDRVTDDGPTYDPRTDTYVGTFDSESASVAIAEALATVRHCEPTVLDPLNDSVDTDSLDRLVDSGSDRLRVTIHLDGFEVAVTGDRRIEITPPE